MPTDGRDVPREPQVLMLLSNSFDPDPRVYAEARALVQAGYRVRILAWDRDFKCPRSEIIDGIEVERIFLRSSHGRGITQALIMPVVYLAMVARALRGGFDLIHAHDLDTLPIGFLLARLRQKPVVYDSHEDFAGMLHGNIPAWTESFLRALETWLVRRVSLLLTVGEKLRKEFERRGCPHAVVVGNWKKLEEFRLDETSRQRTRDELGVPRDAVLLAYITNLGRERRVVELLRAVADRPQVHLVVGGLGPSTDAVKEYARRYSNVHYLGFVNLRDIPRYTAAADALYYGFDMENPNARYSAPNKLFEALAAGRPLISGRFGEIERILSETGGGILLDNFSEQEILRALDLCSDRTLLDSWKQRAADAAEKTYNWKHAEEALLQAYGGVLRTSSSQGSGN